jgi:hypothetical protein
VDVPQIFMLSLAIVFVGSLVTNAVRSPEVSLVVVVWILGGLSSIIVGVAGLYGTWDRNIGWSCIILGIAILGHLLHDAVVSDEHRPDAREAAKTVDENIRWIGTSAVTVIGFVAAFSNNELVPAGRVAIASLVVCVVLAMVSYANYQRNADERPPRVDAVNGLMALGTLWSLFFGLILISSILVGGGTLT